IWQPSRLTTPVAIPFYQCPSSVQLVKPLRNLRGKGYAIPEQRDPHHSWLPRWYANSNSRWEIPNQLLAHDYQKQYLQKPLAESLTHRGQVFEPVKAKHSRHPRTNDSHIATHLWDAVRT